MKKEFDYAVYIGRFQPFHSGHLETLRLALKKAERLIIIVGSHNTPRTIKNPWTAHERQVMIQSVLTKDARQKINFEYVEDRLYQEKEWVDQVQKAVYKHVNTNDKIGIVGHRKDESSYYLNSFPEWDIIETGPYIKETNKDEGKSLSSTKIRELMFEGYVGFVESNVPAEVYHFLENWTHKDTFKDLKEEYNFEIKYAKQFESVPYAANFITTDAVVVQSGSVLMVQRGERPGKGLWALPGGHVDPNESVFDAVLRILREETHLKVPEKVLRGSIRGKEVFDDPDRSLRGRVIKKNARTLTIAYCFELDDLQPLPTNLKTGEGIEKVWWHPLGMVRGGMRDQLFEDHADIIDYFIGRL